MALSAMVDAGALVSILAADEQWHKPCVDALARLHMPLFTSEAVLTEYFHLVAARSLSLNRAWGFVRSGALTVQPMGDADLPTLNALMAQYKDRPMDFADATLVHLAHRESMSLILTIDHADFETYRIGGSKKFTILPERR